MQILAINNKKIKVWVRIDKQWDGIGVCFKFGINKDPDLVYIMGEKYFLYFEVYRFKSGFQIKPHDFWNCNS